MSLTSAILGLVLLAIVLWDVFETIILPRRVTRRIRLARLFYKSTWSPWSWLARRVRAASWRETFLSVFGPLSLLFLFAVWAIGLIIAFSILHFAAGSAINTPGEQPGYWTDLYMSGSTFFTLGLGDVTPRTELARVITVAEAGIGFGFLAVVISYLPVLYGAFSRREANISLLDARAGSPPTAAELLRRHNQPDAAHALAAYLRDWEVWSAELMESHLSYPVLCYFRSQHNNQSWLAALSTMLDVSAILLAYADGALRWQARMTFAISRHAIVDLAQVLNCPPRALDGDRLPAADLKTLRVLLVTTGLAKCRSEDDVKLSELRQMYEPYVAALSDRLLMPVAGWSISTKPRDNWRTSAWARISADRASVEITVSPLSETEETEHF
ncbi:MAG TPA: potassium channel family protein [Candidatus Acidoferrales bacterium]|nr:potassium channel family protein [Candidatus Acidoferrales bacterium]